MELGERDGGDMDRDGDDEGLRGFFSFSSFFFFFFR